MRRVAAAVGAVAAGTVVAGVLTVAAPHPAPAPDAGRPAFTAAALDDPVVLARLRAIDARIHRPPHRHRHRESRSSARTGTTGPTRPPVPGLAAWLDDPETRKILGCETTGRDYGSVAHHGSGTYFGAWQMDEGFVRTYAGADPWRWVRHGRFVMPHDEQDAAAYRGWLDRGYEPWQCA